jgi:predicted GIY-YIG superfamily endonuclease
MTATILPFPILRRYGFISKQAAHAAGMNPDAAARYVEHQIQVQRDAMRRRGVAEDLIARELKLMDAAIRRALLQAQLTGGA